MPGGDYGTGVDVDAGAAADGFGLILGSAGPIMVGIGIVGIGFMGMTHFQAVARLGTARVVALCSRDPKKRAGDWTSIQGNFGPRGGLVDLSDRATYESLDQLLADPAVDLVDLCLPNDEHAAAAVRALEAGKHVIVEKPIALTAADADRMVAASRAACKLLMVAHVLPFFPEFAFAAEAVRSARYGRLLAAHFTRVIAKPDWSDGIGDSRRSGGPAVDLHVHDTHFIGLTCGVPRGVHSRGVVESDAVLHLNTQYLYDDPNLAVSAVSGALSRAGRPFTHGFEIYLEGATLSFSFANLAGTGETSALAVILPDGTVERPTLGSGDPAEAFAAELGLAVKAVAEGTPAPPMLSAELARQALVLCLAEAESVRSGKTVMLD